MLLVIDVGNSNTVLGIYRDDALVRDWRVSSDRAKTSDEYAILIHDLFRLEGIHFTDISAVIISSVVPVLTGVLEKLCRRYLGKEPYVVGPGLHTGMPVLYDNPGEVGADRIVNAVGAYEKYRTALIIVDFGTATTFDAVSRQGEYCGGAIAPGLMISAEALFQKASKLPRIDVAKPAAVIAKNTVTSMQAGVFFGYVGLVDELVGRMKQEMSDEPRVIATGGLAGLIAPETKSIDEVDEYLTLEGLRLLYQRNRDT